MARFAVLFLLTIAALVGVGVAVPDIQARAADPGPPLRTSSDRLAAALDCSRDLSDATKTPVLLVPGTIGTAYESYSWGYQRALRAEGHPVCVIETLPEHGAIDMQTSVEYVVYAVRHMYAVSGRKVSMIGHSQGGTLLGWALRFWPDLSAKVDDAISLAGPAKGTKLANTVICGSGRCIPSGWQISVGSHLAAALNRRPLPAGASFTSIGSQTDEFVFPSSTLAFRGATTITVQQMCHWRPVSHISILADAAAYALVHDALSHPGPANLERVGRAACSQVYFDGVSPLRMTRLLLGAREILDTILNAPRVSSEPRLRSYAVSR